MRVFSREGTFAEMCGNGLRCVAGYLKRFRGFSDEFYVRTDAGLKKCIVSERDGEMRVKLQLGLLSEGDSLTEMSALLKQRAPTIDFLSADLITFNVPHLVIFMAALPPRATIIQVGAELQKWVNANINFAQVAKSDPNHTEINL
jgi:diaminopimelate epimerase